MGAYWGVSGLANKCGRDVHLSDSHSLVFTCSFFFFFSWNFCSVFQKTSYIYSFDCVLIYDSYLFFISCCHFSVMSAFMIVQYLNCKLRLWSIVSTHMVFFAECAFHFRILVTETFNCRLLPEVVQADSKTKNIDHDCKTTNNEDEMRTQRES